jgi:hypothetical protein
LLLFFDIYFGIFLEVEPDSPPLTINASSTSTEIVEYFRASYHTQLKAKPNGVFAQTLVILETQEITGAPPSSPSLGVSLTHFLLLVLVGAFPLARHVMC